MCCSNCSAHENCTYYLMMDNSIMNLCYTCRNMMDRKIASVLIKKATHFLDVFTRISYPF